MSNYVVRVRRVLTEDADVPVEAGDTTTAEKLALALVAKGEVAFEPASVLETLVSYVEEVR